nr:methionine adenosyltransferase [Candidatus Sigynarchaeota archaeon]
NEIASRIMDKAGGDVIEVYVRLLSQIGHPINDPWLGDIELKIAPNADFKRLEKLSLEIAQATLDDWMGMRKKTIDGKVRIW